MKSNISYMSNCKLTHNIHVIIYKTYIPIYLDIQHPPINIDIKILSEKKDKLFLRVHV